MVQPPTLSEMQRGPGALGALDIVQLSDEAFHTARPYPLRAAGQTEAPSLTLKISTVELRSPPELASPLDVAGTGLA